MSDMNEQDILAFLGGSNDEELFERAAKSKEKVFGKDVYLRAVVRVFEYLQ